MSYALTRNGFKLVKFTTFRPACAYSILLFAHFGVRRSNGCEKPGRHSSFFREREREGDVIENRDNDDELETITRLAASLCSETTGCLS